MDPFFWFALGVIGWGGWRLIRWMASGGRLPLRGRRGTASAFSSAGLAGQAFYQPAARRALEACQDAAEHREHDDEGDPPEPGGDDRP